jgi:hypothetical protein
MTYVKYLRRALLHFEILSHLFADLFLMNDRHPDAAGLLFPPYAACQG